MSNFQNLILRGGANLEELIDIIWSNVKHGLDILFVRVIAPIFSAIGTLLYLILLKPLELLQLPIFLQVLIIGGLTGILSIYIKKMLRVTEKEQAFFEKFEKMKAVQKNFDLMEDWKARKVLYEASDKEIDEEYNTFIAQKFSHFGMVYLLPIFLTLFWLDTVYPASRLEALNGLPYTIIFPSQPFGLPGLSVPVTFFIGYIFVHLAWSRINKKRNKNRQKTH